MAVFISSFITAWFKVLQISELYQKFKSSFINLGPIYKFQAPFQIWELLVEALALYPQILELLCKFQCFLQMANFRGCYQGLKAPLQIQELKERL